MPERPHYRSELISLLLPRYYSSSTWGVVGRSTLAGNGVSPAWFVEDEEEYFRSSISVTGYKKENCCTDCQAREIKWHITKLIPMRMIMKKSLIRLSTLSIQN